MKRFIKKKVYKTCYSYDSLPSDPGAIRLLTVQPAKRKSAALECTLSTATLRDRPSYEALSYVWGDLDDLMLMLIGNKRFAITYNLLEALEALRLHDRPRILWVDAVCINQADDWEKSMQVLMMRQIYSSAAHVVIWAGGSSVQIPQAMRFMEETVSNDSGIYGISQLIEHLADENWLYWSAINDLFGRAWFTRIWVCQEFAFANSRHFQYGDDIISDTLVISYIEKLAESWSKFMSWGAENGIVTISPNDPHPARRFHALIHSRAFSMLNMVRLRGRAPELLPLLSGLITSKQASDLRDRIYALLGFVRVEEADPYQDLLRPDYTLTARQVFTRTMAYLLLTHANLNALNEVKDTGPPLLELPSWVTDWEVGHASLIFTADDPAQKELLYNAGGRHRLDPDRIDLIAESIRLDGYTIDTVHEVFRLAEVTDEIELVQHWLQVLSPKMDQQYPLGGSFREAFWRTIFANRFPQEVEEESGASKIYDKKIDESVSGVCAMPPATEDEEITLHGSVANSPVRDGFRLFITMGGLLGLVYGEVPEQNVIVVLLGGRSPYILEPRRLEFAFRKECYVHGIMNGEALLEHTRGDRKLETFVLV